MKLRMKHVAGLASVYRIGMAAWRDKGFEVSTSLEWSIHGRCFTGQNQR